VAYWAGSRGRFPGVSDHKEETAAPCHETGAQGALYPLKSVRVRHFPGPPTRETFARSSKAPDVSCNQKRARRVRRERGSESRAGQLRLGSREASCNAVPGHRRGSIPTSARLGRKRILPLTSISYLCILRVLPRHRNGPVHRLPRRDCKECQGFVPPNCRSISVTKLEPSHSGVRTDFDAESGCTAEVYEAIDGTLVVRERPTHSRRSDAFAR